MQIIDLVQGSAEWKAFRSNKIMASESSIILDVNPWTTPLQLWKQKLGLLPETQSNAAMEKGHRLEPIAREYFCVQADMDFQPCVVLSDDHPWMGASLDGLSECGRYILEIKCGGEKLYTQAENGEIPEYYMAQMQHQLAVTGLELCYYFVYYEGKGISLEVFRDDVYIQRLIVEGKRFWDCIQNLEQPQLSDKDYIQRDSREWANEAITLKYARDQIKHFETIEKQATQNLIQLAGQSNSLGAGIKLSKCTRKGTVDYKKIINDYNICDEESYRKPDSEYFRITEV